MATALPARWIALTLLLTAAGAARAHAVSFQEERDLGRNFDLAAHQQLPFVKDPEVVAYVERVGQRIVGHLDDSFFEYHFGVVREGSVNAFAVPGGYVYVHSGLLMRISSDDELAAVLGHEVAHVHAHHLARQQEATRLMNYASLLGMLVSIIQPAVGALATAANAAATLQYRREFEQEADYLGARYVREAGFDERAALDFFKKLADQSRAQPNLAPPYLLSHPVTDERLNHLEAVLRTQQWSPRERAPASAALRRAQVIARARTELPADVLTHYRNILDEEPSDPMRQYQFGLACLETGQLENATTTLTAAREGGVVAAERELGRLALRRREPEAARDLLRRAVEADPADVGALTELAATLETLGDREGSMKAYRRAVDQAPWLESAQYGYGLAAGRAGDQAEGFYHLATAARLGGDYEKALSQYVRAAPVLGPAGADVEDARGWIRQLSEFLHVAVPATPGPADASAAKEAKGD